MKFEWDGEKEIINLQKRGVSFEQASYVFADPFALNKYDDAHSHKEDSRKQGSHLHNSNRGRTYTRGACWGRTYASY